jgi:hypothetical protein
MFSSSILIPPYYLIFLKAEFDIFISAIFVFETNVSNFLVAWWVDDSHHTIVAVIQIQTGEGDGMCISRRNFSATAY